jgi:hypothetical protein
MRKILRGLGIFAVGCGMFLGMIYMGEHRQGGYVSAIYVLPYAIAVLFATPLMTLIENICDRLHLPER